MAIGALKGTSKAGTKAAGAGARAAGVGAKLTGRGAARLVRMSRSGDGEGTRSTAISAGLGAATGAAGAYLFDPDSGKRRRAIARDRAAGLFRRGARKTASGVETAAGRATDKARGAASAAKRAAEGEQPAANDQALADRVKSEVLRPEWVPKGSININAEAGVVYLRGEVERPEQIKKLIDLAEGVDGVLAVESLLHPPKTPAGKKKETKKETRRRVRKAAS